MKRFLLFGSDMYYPAGGWDDFVGDFDTLEQANAFGRNAAKDWVHIVDTAQLEIVEAGTPSCLQPVR